MLLHWEEAAPPDMCAHLFHASISVRICLAGLISFSGLSPTSLNNWSHMCNQTKPGLLSSGEELVNEMARFISNYQ